jgi:hypothetical protein
VGLAPTGKRRLFTAHADSGRSLSHYQTAGVDPLLTFGRGETEPNRQEG